MNRKIADSRWLDRCAVGVLKTFSSVDRVNKRLRDRGFSFTSKYLGGKLMLWSFETEHESEGFVRSNFFWEDTFISMEKGYSSLAYRTRLVWANIRGTPMSHCNETFFKKIGDLLGEFLLIEDDTAQRRRLD
ncbi:hypothetical protein Dsin_020472 [Dipteronia sinensis]|uniref:DUF4283 domain-containing protein n=1 Tax=Dipteronia sinensis TaxID=43782 RepID=A0AAE0E411_9ROSI|nr:hypothetical protein Dsin_020472 [Dipteronia sinensis]